jgi:hypothetical protein
LILTATRLKRTAEKQAHTGRGYPFQVLPDVRLPRCRGPIHDLAHWHFGPKNWEEREVPVPQKLIALLENMRPRDVAPDDSIFTNATGRPDGAMLEKLKAVAWRGELNCGHCATVQKLKDGTERIKRCNAGP